MSEPNTRTPDETSPPISSTATTPETTETDVNANPKVDDIPPPPYTDNLKTPQLQARHVHFTLDEEHHTGFWGEPTDPYDEGSDASWGVAEVLNAIAYAFLLFMLVLNVDLLVGRLGWFESSFFPGSVSGYSASGSGIPGIVVGDVAQIYICRTPNSNSRIWRYVPDLVSNDAAAAAVSDTFASCHSEVVTLSTTSSEAELLHPGDEILFGEEEGATQDDVSVIGGGTFITSGEGQGEERPDDGAEEGVLGRPMGDGSYMHAGFGGRWTE